MDKRVRDVRHLAVTFIRGKFVFTAANALPSCVIAITETTYPPVASSGQSGPFVSPEKDQPMFLDQVRFRVISDDSSAPDLCPLCTIDETLFAYSISQPDERDSEGFCCLRCSQQLLATLQEIVVARWVAQREARTCQGQDSLPIFWSPKTWKLAFLLLKAKLRYIQ